DRDDAVRPEKLPRLQPVRQTRRLLPAERLPRDPEPETAVVQVRRRRGQATARVWAHASRLHLATRAADLPRLRPRGDGQLPVAPELRTRASGRLSDRQPPTDGPAAPAGLHGTPVRTPVPPPVRAAAGPLRAARRWLRHHHAAARRWLRDPPTGAEEDAASPAKARAPLWR